MSVSAETAREWLLRQVNPEQADAALRRSLTSTLGVTAKPRTEWRFPEGSPPYAVTVGCEFDVTDTAQIPAALAKIEQAMTPASADQCEGWLVMLQAATAHRADSEFGSAVSYSLYAAELRRWPADVAKAACELLARGKPGKTGTNWFPTLAELVAECERMAGPRRAMHSALQRWTPKPAPHPNDRRFGEPSEAEKARVHRMAEEAKAALREAAVKMAPRGKYCEPLPNTAGKPDEGGLTPEMRELMARRAEQ